MLRRLRPPADGTKNWREDPYADLLADLDRFTLSGVALGDEIEGLSFLGPSATGAFDYPHKGLRFDVDDTRLEGFMLALREGVELGPGTSGATRTQAFAGRIRIRKRDFLPHELNTEKDFRSTWGDPYWRDEDEDEILLFYEFPVCEVQVELSLEGNAQILIVATPPLLSDPDQRARYGVTKPWPVT